MRQVFANLFSNAIKYTGKRERAVIDVGTARHHTGNVIYVRDNGAGFDPRHASRIFAPFQRLHNGNEFEGVGVGLAIVHKHGGEIWAESEVGQGATFYFSLRNV